MLTLIGDLYCVGSMKPIIFVASVWRHRLTQHLCPTEQSLHEDRDTIQSLKCYVLNKRHDNGYCP
jgi:hypothetical protein